MNWYGMMANLIRLLFPEKKTNCRNIYIFIKEGREREREERKVGLHVWICVCDCLEKRFKRYKTSCSHYYQWFWLEKGTEVYWVGKHGEEDDKL